MKATDIKRKLDRKAEAFRRFDALPPKERKRLTDQGCNPHEPEQIRNRKQALVKAQIRKDLDRLPEEVRSRIRGLGLFDNSANALLHRLTR